MLESLASHCAEGLSRGEDLEAVFASVVDALVLYDVHGRVTRMNPAAVEMLGQTPDDRCFTDVEGKPVAHEQLPVFAALRGETVRGVPLGFVGQDGRRAWTTAGAAPLRAADGSIVGAVLSLGDVGRLHDLHEQREDLSRMISHDLRAPLGIILGHAKLIGRRAEPPEALRARAEAIATSAQRMASMLNDLLESALLEAGKLRLDRSPVDVTALLRDLRARLAPLDADRVRLVAPEDSPPVPGDRERLERVFMNLLTNALKYSGPGSDVTVRVATEEGSLVVDVEDRGQGISPEDVPHLFERYFRGAGAARLEGTGLGLYTARMLAQAHGGTVEVSSVRGQGSTFRVRLPTAREAG